MDNQQVSIYEETFIVHPVYSRVAVSNKGNVICSKTGRVRYKFIGKQGYFVFRYGYEGKWKTLKVHRLVTELHLPSPSEELVLKCSQYHHGKVLVRHLDNNKTNNDVHNLEWCDVYTNNKQARDDGLVPSLKGSLNGRAKLTEEFVHELCKFYEQGGTPLEAQKLFGISSQQATKIRAGFQWKHIWEQYDIKVNRRRK